MVVAASRLLDVIRQDLSYAVRSLRRHRAFTASCLATLAIGLGGMITILCVVSTFLWTPLPFPRASRLSIIKEVDPRHGLWPFSEPTFLDLADRSHSLQAVSACRRGEAALTRQGDPLSIHSAAVTPRFFRMFGIQTLAGRLPATAPDNVVISRGLWQRKWLGNPSVIGQTVKLDGKSFLISGVVEPPHELLPGVDVFLPLVPEPGASRTQHDLDVYALAKASIPESQVQAELNTIASGIAREHLVNNAGWGMRAVPLFEYLLGARTPGMLWMVLGGVALVWLLACSNVAGLQLARRIAQKQETGTRLALGASHGRLLAQSLIESILLAVIGATLGLGISVWTIQLLRRLASDSLPRLAELHIDTNTVALTLLCLFFSTLLFGIWPMHRSLLPEARGSAGRDSGREVLMIAQVALASVLILSATLLFQSFLKLQSVNPGFDAASIWISRIDPSTHSASYRQRTALLRNVTENLSRVPGVASVGATNVAPFGGSGTANRFRLPGEPESAGFHSAAWRAVTPGFFHTVNLPLKRGRLFTQADTDTSPQVVIISESMAREFFAHHQDPLGKRLLWGSSKSPKTIVGIVGDLRDLSLGAAPTPTMFRPFAQLSDAPMSLVLRLKTVSPYLIASIRHAIWSVDPETPVALQPLSATMSASLLPERGTLQIMAAFAFIALTIAAFGLYGLVSYRVNQRRTEIAIRLALGASANTVRWHIQRRCLVLVAAGLGIGLPLAYVLSRFISSLLYQTSRTHVASYALVLIVFTLIALLASYGPAKRATRFDPASLMRHE